MEICDYFVVYVRERVGVDGEYVVLGLGGGLYFVERE